MPPAKYKDSDSLKPNVSETKPSTSTSTPEKTKHVEKAEKPKKTFKERRKWIDVERKRKLYTNPRKQVKKKYLKTESAIIPLTGTIRQKDPRLDFYLSFVNLPSTSFGKAVEQPVLHITEVKEKEQQPEPIKKTRES